MRITRREFFEKTGKAAGVFLLNKDKGKTDIKKSRISDVIIAKSARLIRRKNDIDFSSAKEYINRGVEILSGKKGVRDSWGYLFGKNERVGIKLSCLPGRKLSSSAGIVQAVVEGLISAGIKERNIIIWERSDRELVKAGFGISYTGVKTFGTDNVRAGGYSKKIEISGSVGTCFSNIIYRVDSLINIPVLKDHDIAGISCGMKNFYGAIFNPNKFHSNGCNPYVADLNNHHLIKDKLKLVICDASRLQIHNGPAYYPKYSVDYGGLIMSTDPVAADYSGWKLVEEVRRKKGLKSLDEEGRSPEYILTAAKMGLGNGKDSRINYIGL